MAEKNGIQVSAGFDLKSRSFLDIRQSFETLNELIATPESQVPSGFISFCEEDGKYYQFLADNESTALGKWRVWMGSAADAAENNGKIKIDAASDLQFLGEALDGKTLVVDTDKISNKKVIKAVSIDGLEATIEELNHLKGLNTDIVDLFDTIGNPMNFRGVLADDAALELKKDTADDGDMYIITASDSMGAGGPVVVVYDGNDFRKIANVDFEVRDFETNPIDLTKEVTGVLPEAKIDAAIARADDVLDKATYAVDGKDGVVKSAETIDGFDASDLTDAITAAQHYDNNEVAKLLTKEGDGTKYLADNGEYQFIDADAVVTSDTEPENKKALWNHVETTESGEHTYVLKYYSDNGDGTGTWIPIVSSDDPSEIIDREDPTTVALGDIKAGTVLTGLSAAEVLIKAMYAYKAPEITSFSINPSTTLYKVGTTINSVSLSTTVKKISKTITNVEFFKDGTSLEAKTEGVGTGGTFTHSYDTPITINTPGSVKFSVKASDGDNTPEKSATIEFINPMYWGYTGQNPTEKLQKKGEISLTGLNPVDNSVFVMYPASYGNIKSIKDPNNFEVIDTFTKTTQDVTVVSGENAVSYNVYTSPVATNSNFSYKFTF